MYPSSNCQNSTAEDERRDQADGLRRHDLMFCPRPPPSEANYESRAVLETAENMDV